MVETRQCVCITKRIVQILTIGKRIDIDSFTNSSFSFPSLSSAAIRHKVENERRALIPSSSPYLAIFLGSIFCFFMFAKACLYQSWLFLKKLVD